jgi:hypothetical protein
MNDLSLFNAALLTDLIGICLVLVGYIQSKQLILWYKKFGLAAVLADTLSLMIGFLIASFLYPFFFKSYNLGYFLMLVVAVQLTHDSIFGVLVTQFKGRSDILQVFKDYAKEMGFKILMADAIMMISTTLLHNILQHYKEENIVLAIVLLYVTPYLLFSV